MTDLLSRFACGRRVRALSLTHLRGNVFQEHDGLLAQSLAGKLLERHQHLRDGRHLSQ